MNADNTVENQRFDAAELGAMMREMRENLGHDLADVAADLRIRLVYLEAIESGRLSDLPGNAYISGFLRAYSDYLGLDGEEIVRRFRMAGVDISNQTQLHLPSPVEEGRLPTGPLLLLAAIVAAAAYGGWYYFSSPDGDPVDKIARLPAELSRMVDDARENSAAVSTPAPPAAASERSDSADTAPGGTPAQPAAPATAETPADTPMASAAETGTGGSAAAPAADAEPQQSEITAPGAPAQPPMPSPPDAANAAETPAAAPEPAPEPQAQTATAPSEPPPADAPAETPAAEQQAALPAPAAEPAPPAPAEPDATESPDDTPAPSVSQPPAPASPSAAAAPAEGASSDTGSATRIVVRAKTDSFVAVLTSDNQPLFSQLMRAGDSYEVPSGVGLVLETGNAGALEILVGGERVPALGPLGEIRRNIPLDAEKLRAGIN